MPSSKDIENLNQRFAIPGIASVVMGNGGLPKVQVTSPAAAADIYLQGAQVTSWKPAGSDEVIFLSEKSRFEDGRAIRGGIPICFPWFRAKANDPKAPAHGIVRTKAWELVSIAESAGGVVVTLATETDESSDQWWHSPFRLVHRVTVGAALKLELIATNTGTVPFKFEEALHTYHRVGDVNSIRVAGLDGMKFLDNNNGNAEKTQAGEVIFLQATDNAYLNTRDALELMDPVLGRKVHIEKKHSLTTIVWNPWEQAAKGLADLGNDEWLQMACVEASNILGAAVTLAPGEEHIMSATISVSAA